MQDLSVLQNLPTRERPILIGLMVDVAGSMVSSIGSTSGTSKGRLESFRDALDDFVKKGKELCQDESSQQIIPRFKLFAYGFGFGNPLAVLFAGKKPVVRDLLDAPGTPTSTIAIDQLFENWQTYQSHVTGMIPQMFGKTPMLEAFAKAKERFAKEREQQLFHDPPILFVLSDGEPTDGPSDKVIEIAEDLKSTGILIISCYVTKKNNQS